MHGLLFLWEAAWIVFTCGKNSPPYDIFVKVKFSCHCPTFGRSMICSIQQPFYCHSTGYMNSTHEHEDQHPEEVHKTLQIYCPQSGSISDYWREKYEKEAKKYWDIFYMRNVDKFFKDRHYLDKEWGQYFQKLNPLTDLPKQFPPLQSTLPTKVVFEMGCGVGNTLFPLLSTYPNIFMHACDFSPRAINLVKSHKEYTENRIHAFICDMTLDDAFTDIPLASVDVVLLVFTLSAVSVEKMPKVLQNISHVLKINGHVLLRDYSAGDLAQERLSNKGRRISDNFYVRGDGTRVYYFTEDALRNLFTKEGFVCEEMKICERKVENRLRKIVMNRRWIQASFQLVGISSNTHSKMYKPSDQKYQRDDLSSICNTESEVDLSEGSAADLFGGPVFEVMHVKVGTYTFRVKCLSKENQHTYRATGFMLWESARFLATLLIMNPTAIARRTVLELGSGSVGICSMVAAKYADLAIATDGDPCTMDLLIENIQANKMFFTPGKLFPQVLRWGREKDMALVMEKTGNAGFDIIIGTDVMYVKEAVPLLFATSKALIADGEHKEMQPLLLLCQVTRQVDDIFIVTAASQFGFYLKDQWPYDTNRSSSLRIIESLFTQGLDVAFATCNSIQFLCFASEK